VDRCPDPIKRLEALCHARVALEPQLGVAAFCRDPQGGTRPVARVGARWMVAAVFVLCTEACVVLGFRTRCFGAIRRTNRLAIGGIRDDERKHKEDERSWHGKSPSSPDRAQILLADRCPQQPVICDTVSRAFRHASPDSRAPMSRGCARRAGSSRLAHSGSQRSWPSRPAASADCVRGVGQGRRPP